MRRLTWLICALGTTLLSATDLRIDHVSVAGHSLKTMQAALAGAGIASEYGGRHSNHATEMAVTSFGDGSYLELIALQPDADPKAVAAHDWSKQLQNDSGPAAWAARVDDVSTERERLGRLHVSVSAPEKSGRARPDGVRLEWETAQVDREPRGTFFPFLIRDFTARTLRVFPSGKPTMPALRGLTRVVIATADLKVSIARFRAAYDWAAPVEQDDPGFGGRVAVFAGSPVVLVSPLGENSWIGGRLGKFGDGPCAYVIATPEKSRFKTPTLSRWAGTEIRWADPGLLGWHHLGFE